MFKDFSIRTINKKKLVIVITILLLIISSITTVIMYFRVPNVRLFFDKYLFRKNITQGTLPSIPISSSNIYVFKNNILELNENTLTVYNKNGGVETSFDIKIMNPVTHSNGNYFVIAEKNGHKIYLISNNSVVWEKDVDGNIADVYVNQNGYVVISITGTTYKTIVSVYSQDSTELFRIYRATTNVMDFAISHDNKYLALAETDTSGAVIKSSINIIDATMAVSDSSSAVVYTSSAPSNSWIINLEYNKGNVLSCIYDDHIETIIDNAVTEVSSFTKSNIIFADINNKIIQVEKKSVSIINSTFELQIINSDNGEKKYYELDKEPQSIYVYGNTIAINYGTEALFINNSSWLIKHYTSYEEIQGISLSDNLAIIIFKNNAEIVSL